MRLTTMIDVFIQRIKINFVVPSHVEVHIVVGSKFIFIFIQNTSYGKKEIDVCRLSSINLLPWLNCIESLIPLEPFFPADWITVAIKIVPHFPGFPAKFSSTSRVIRFIIMIRFIHNNVMQIHFSLVPKLTKHYVLEYQSGRRKSIVRAIKGRTLKIGLSSIKLTLTVVYNRWKIRSCVALKQVV